MTHSIEATAKVYLSLIDGKWELAANMTSGPDISLDGSTYCDHDCIKHQDGETPALPSPYELAALLHDSLFPAPFTTRLVYLESEDTYHSAWTQEQAEQWAREHIQVGFPLATVLRGEENGDVIAAFRNEEEYDYDANGEPI